MANNPKKYAGESTLSALANKIKELFVSKTDFNSSLSNKADKSHTHSISDTTNLQSTLDGKVPTSRTINNKPLTANITLSASDVGAASSTHDHNDKYYQKSEVDSALSNKSDKTHNHDSAYAAKTHNHDGVYALEGHNHDLKYDAKNSASNAVSAHNTSTSSHNDIRISINELTTKLNNFLDVDDTTTDQLSELLALINDNAADIESITNGKVNVSDIINNLTTNVTNKPLSAAQGVAIKTLIDALQDELDTHKHSASDITSGTLSSDRLPVVPITKGGTGANNAATARANIGAVSKTGDTMSGNLNIQLDTDTAPQITMKAEANSSGKRGTANIRKYAFANSDYGTEIEDKTFDGSFMRLNLKASATSPAELITFKNRVYSGSSYSDKEYKLYGEHNKPTLSDIGVAATATELNYVDGVTSNIQTQIDSKLDADAITGGASTIVSDNLTTNRVLVSDNYGKVGASSITGGELNYLDGATRNIQAQLDDLADAVNDKVNVFGDTMTGNLIIEPNNTYSPRIQLIGNENASGQQAEASFMKGANSSVDNGTSIVDTTFDGRETTLTIQSNKQFDEQKLSLRIADANGNYEDYYIYGEHHMPTATELGVLENSDTDLHDFITERNAMYASNIVGDDVMPFIDVSLKSGRKITVNELLKYLKNNSGMASVATVTQAEYTALEEAQATNANTLYMITDAEEEIIPQIQMITWEEND